MAVCVGAGVEGLGVSRRGVAVDAEPHATVIAAKTADKINK